MGSYINSIDNKAMGTFAYDKIQALMNAGAIPLVDENEKPIEVPKEYQENMVCIVDNGWMAACGYAYSKEEFKSFIPTPSDTRPRYWFIFDRVKEFAEPKYWENEN